MIALKYLILASFFFAPSQASINLPSQASLTSRSTVSLSTSVPSISSKRQQSYSRRSGTAFVDPATVLTTVGAFYQNQPYASAFVTCAIKGVAADLVAQNSQAKKQPRRPRILRGGAMVAHRFDMKRNMAFLLYSGMYQGVALEFIYNTLFPKLFGSSVALKVLFSMFILSPFVTLPVAYIFKALVFGNSVGSSIEQYTHDVFNNGLLKTFWAIWIPVQTFVFAVVPEHLRISFMAAVSFIWLIIFSAISSK